MSKRVVAGLVAGIAVVAAVGFVAYRMAFAPSEDAAARLVPDDAVFYATAFLDPSNGQKRALEDLIARFPRLETPERTRGLVERFVDEQLRAAGVDATYEDDVSPALGDQVALYVAADSGADLRVAALVDVEDRDALDRLVAELREAGGDPDVERRSYRGVDYELAADDDFAAGYVEDFYVLATEDAFEDVVDVSEGAPSLADTERYDVADELEDDRLGTLWVDLDAVLDIPGVADDAFEDAAPDERALIDRLRERFVGAFAFGAFVRSDGAVLEVATDRELGSGLAGGLGDLLEDAWVAVAVNDVGTALRDLLSLGARLENASPVEVEDVFAQVEAQTGLDLEQTLGRIGDARAFVAGGIAFGGPDVGVVLDARDAADVVADVRSAAERAGAPVQDVALAGHDDGFTIAAGVSPVHVVADGDRVVAALGDDAALALLEPDETLDDAETFRAARDLLGVEPSLFVDLATPVAFVQTFAGAGADDAEPWLEPLGHVSFGVDRRDGATVARLAVGVTEEDEE
ncbi:MAG TPA: DUF3352 domain-containing protein [Actinomycetota bacterium]|nr:DUF3352 domain-containing protein [Actinomycetota bacterium]